MKTPGPKPIEQLLQIMARLRSRDGGCPWDLEQTFASIAPYTIEEAYEVADAIESGDPEQLRDELGDLLFQVIFHSRLAEEAGRFQFDDVVAAICDKMTRRHPHVFGSERIASSADQSRAWEEHKKRERADEASPSLLDGIARGLPALTLANKVGKRAASVGFDWPDWRGARAKVDEELRELDALDADRGRSGELAAELGDVLLALVNLSRHLGVDPETALRASNTRFEQRFRHLEERVLESGRQLQDLDAAEFDILWNAAKTALKQP
ncbi:MAG TPA: nucleoside triphosphate pyrophosphohydrolase [Steroidobacteraceae bacterium]|nr:nucleoside triphosphate pyrophosphohydrolase [Steroidobacteraceae bacterium]